MALNSYELVQNSEKRENRSVCELCIRIDCPGPVLSVWIRIEKARGLSDRKRTDRTGDVQRQRWKEKPAVLQDAWVRCGMGGKIMNKKQKKVLIRIIVAAALIVVLSLLPAEGWLQFMLFMVPYLVIGYDILKKAWKGICNKQVFDENFLMAIATIGAILLGDYKEGVAVMLFYQIGELFQSYAVGKSRRNISELMDIRPDYANVERDGKLEQVDPDEVAIGTTIIVQPGEKVPIDGIVTEGKSSLNTSALTGESLPRDVSEGEEVISGCINMTGVLHIRTTKEFGESTVAKVLELVENSSSRKSRSENFISKFARIYTPAVCYGALALAILPPLVRMFGLGLPPEWGDWI